VTGFRLLAVVVLLTCLAGPVAEMFDWWDVAQAAGDDTEANAVVIAMCVGGAMLMARAFVMRLQLFLYSRRPRSRFAESCSSTVEVTPCRMPEIALSPPVSLRI
jgi:hypothetical protein